MAAATQTVLTNSGVNTIWRKAQGDLVEGINFLCDEYEMLEEFGPELKVNASLREMTFPTDITEGAGIASIGEGGYEARPSSPNAVDATVSFIHLNGRFNVAKLARWADEADGGAGAIEKQIVFQARHKIRDLARDFSDRFYGFSTAYLAQTSTNATQASGTYTLTNGYGSSTITDAAFIASKFKVGDYVALVRAGALVSNAIGQVTAVTPATPSIAVTWAGSVDSDANDYVVKANSMENTTLSGGTDYNRGLTGLLDLCTSTTVHGISGSTYDNWNVAYSDTSSGRFSGVKFHRAQDEIANEGGGKANLVLMDQGVYRDVFAASLAALRYASPAGMEQDGSVKFGGIAPIKSRRVPPGYVFMLDKKRALRRKALLGKPGMPSWGDGKELIDQSGWVFAIDLPLLMATPSRKNIAYFSAQTTQ